MKLAWSETAMNDLAEVRSFIAERDPSAARAVASAIRKASRRLREFPASGRSGRIPGTRELVVPGLPYVLPYTVDRGRIVILAVIHAARDWPDEN